MPHYVQVLRAINVRVLSFKEIWVDTGGPVGELLLAIFGWVVQQERQRRCVRVRAA